MDINDIGPVASNYITEFFTEEKNKNLIEDLLRLGVKPKSIEVNNDNMLSSQSVVITGSFNSIARSQLKEELIRAGARVTSSVSSKTDFLVAGDKPGSKLSKAQDLNIPLRIGVNAGSIEKDLQKKYGEPTSDALVESAMRHVEILDSMNFNNFKLSLKRQFSIDQSCPFLLP